MPPNLNPPIREDNQDKTTVATTSHFARPTPILKENLDSSLKTRINNIRSAKKMPRYFEANMRKVSFPAHIVGRIAHWTQFLTFSCQQKKSLLFYGIYAQLEFLGA